MNNDQDILGNLRQLRNRLSENSAKRTAIPTKIKRANDNLKIVQKSESSEIPQMFSLFLNSRKFKKHSFFSIWRSKTQEAIKNKPKPKPNNSLSLSSRGYATKVPIQTSKPKKEELKSPKIVPKADVAVQSPKSSDIIMIDDQSSDELMQKAEEILNRSKRVKQESPKISPKLNSSPKPTPSYQKIVFSSDSSDSDIDRMINRLKTSARVSPTKNSPKQNAPIFDPKILESSSSQLDEIEKNPTEINPIQLDPNAGSPRKIPVVPKNMPSSEFEEDDEEFFEKLKKECQISDVSDIDEEED